MLGFFLKEVAKTVAIGAGAEVIRNKIVPPVANKVREKLEKIRRDLDDEQDESSSEDSSKVYEANWE